MLLVATILKPSPLHGLGVFLAEPVRRGQRIWRFDPRIDRLYDAKAFAELPEIARTFVKTYGVYNQSRDLWLACGDDARFINHASPANTKSLEAAIGDDIALADLAVGTEITCDYRAICDAVRADPDFADYRPV